MKNLTEAIIKYISGSEAGNEVDTTGLDRDNRISVDNFVKNGTIFNQDAIKNIRDLIVDSIMKHGVDTVHNKILAFVTSSKISNLEMKPITFEQGQLLFGEIQKSTHIVDSKGQLLPFATSWIFDPRAYDDDIYKLKALIFLSDEDKAKDYNPTENVPLEDILKAKNKQEVDKILNNWAVSDESESSGSSKPSRESVLPDSKEDWIEYLKRAFPGVDVRKLEQAATASYRKGRPIGEALVDFVAAMILP